MPIFFLIIRQLVCIRLQGSFGGIFIDLFSGEFVGLMFDESVLPDVRHFFEDIISKLSVFMAQQGTPTVIHSTFRHSFDLHSFFSVW